MLKRALGLFLLATLCACAGGDAPEGAPPGDGFDRDMLGRWDVTVTGEDSYPLWFELVERDGVLQGRLQPRGGHALPFDEVEASGSELTARVGETRYRGVFEGNGWQGSGARGESSFDWVAVRAPELPAPNDPSWGEPIELFNGADLTGWVPLPGGESQWKAEDGVLVNVESGANLRTEATFRDFELHIEVNVPAHSNSGIYLRGRHEVQVVDNATENLLDVQTMGAIYGQIAPSTDATHPAGEWQVFDITLLGRWITVVLNGETIIDYEEIPGITGGALDSKEGEPGPIYLQGDHGPVQYRNIVLTPAN